jgi:SAM-dependent methyltransferase
MSKTYQAIAEFYDDEYEQLGMLQRDVPFYLNLLPKRPARVLALACGTGRDAIPLAQAGHHVVGVDLFDDMLAVARHKQKVTGIDAKRLRFVQQNLLTLDLNETFDHAACLFNGFIVFITLADQDRVLQNIAKHLRSKGTLVIDVFNPDNARIHSLREEDVQPETFFSRALGATVMRTMTLWRDASLPQVRHARFNYTWHDAQGRRKKRAVEFTNTWIMPREMVMLLERNGYTVTDLWGDYDRSPVSVHSPRLIVRARVK